MNLRSSTLFSEIENKKKNTILKIQLYHETGIMPTLYTVYCYTTCRDNTIVKHIALTAFNADHREKRQPRFPLDENMQYILALTCFGVDPQKYDE